MIEIYEYEVDEIIKFLNKNIIRTENGYIKDIKPYSNLPRGSILKSYVSGHLYSWHDFNCWLGTRKNKKEDITKITKEDVCHMGQMFFYDWKMRKVLGIQNDVQIIKEEHLKEAHCRVCKKEIITGMGQINDYLTIRDKNCIGPICLKCSKENPDEFHKQFNSAKEMLDIEQKAMTNIRKIGKKMLKILK